MRVFLKPFLAAVVVVAVVGCGGASPPRGRPPAPVRVVTATQEALPLEIKAVGTVTPLSTVQITARVSGPVRRITFKEGQRVEKGALLFEVDPAPFQVALAQAQAALESDQATLVRAQAEAARARALLEQKMTAVADVDDKNAAELRAAAAVKASTAAVDNARLRLSWTQVTSPITGRTDRRQIDVGNIVRENSDVVVVVREMAPIQVAFSIPQESLFDVQTKMQSGGVDVVASLPDHPDVQEHGVLTFIASAVDTSTGTVACKADFANKSESLWPGAFARVRIALASVQDAVVVPATAVQHGQQGAYVFVVKGDSTAELRPVRVSGDSGGKVAIASGVAAGDRVVVDGQLNVAPGATVVVKDDAPPAGRLPPAAATPTPTTTTAAPKAP